LIYAINYAIKKWLTYGETLEKEYSENYLSVHIEVIGPACINGQLLHTKDEAVSCRWCELHLIPDYMQWYNTGELHLFYSFMVVSL